MSIISAKCTNCGGDIQVDSSQQAMICPFCGCNFIVEQAVNNYNYTYNTTNNINAQVVNIYQSAPANTTAPITPSSDFVINGNVLKSYIGSSFVVTIVQ